MPLWHDPSQLHVYVCGSSPESMGYRWYTEKGFALAARLILALSLWCVPSGSIEPVVNAIFGHDSHLRLGVYFCHCHFSE